MGLSEARVCVILNLTQTKRISYPALYASNMGDVPHNLPNCAQHQGLPPIHDIGTLNAHQVHLILDGEVDDVVAVFHSFEPRKSSMGNWAQFLVIFSFCLRECSLGRGASDRLGLVDAFPDH